MSQPQDHAGNEPEEGGSDPFAPPAEACECYCLHCGRTFMSNEIWFQRVIGDPHLDGFWMCPTPNCGGAGFTFDIFPTDPDHPANEGWQDFADDEFEPEEEAQEDSAESEWDPAEPAYQEFADDLAGEEWKLGGESVDESEDPLRRAAEAQDEEEQRYNMPDERPRVIDWSQRQDRQSPDDPEDWDEDDIPF